MQFEKIRRINKSKIIVGGVIGLGVIVAISILPSFAKYKLTKSINIANGTVNYKVPDINIVALYTKDEEEYIESNSIPTSGYVLNTEKSICKIYDGSTSLENALTDNSITIEYSNGKVNFLGVNKRNTRCYLYFDKQKNLTVDNIIATLDAKSETPDFSQVATTDEGVFKTTDGMYSGTSYYWRGATTTNYVKFANLCWRIVRINGDSSIRLIYDGTTCHANGTSTTESLAVTNQKYNASWDRSEYVGYTYTSGSQRGTTTASNLKTKTEEWYKTNITDKGFDGKVATGKFCNDRNTGSGYSWSSQPTSTFYYAGYDRSGAKSSTSVTPTLSCTNSSDIYSLKAGAITMDEVVMAGGKLNTANSSYYLYNGQYYWTMSPYYLYYHDLSGHSAGVFLLHNGGQFAYNHVHWTGAGVRPVINLLSNTQFKSGTDGTLNNPYEVI